MRSIPRGLLLGAGRGWETKKSGLPNHHLLPSILWPLHRSPDNRVNDQKNCHAQRKHTNLFIVEYVAVRGFTHTILTEILQLFSASP